MLASYGAVATVTALMDSKKSMTSLPSNKNRLEEGVLVSSSVVVEVLDLLDSKKLKDSLPLPAKKNCKEEGVVVRQRC